MHNGARPQPPRPSPQPEFLFPQESDLFVILKPSLPRPANRAATSDSQPIRADRWVNVPLVRCCYPPRSFQAGVGSCQGVLVDRCCSSKLPGVPVQLQLPGDNFPGGREGGTRLPPPSTSGTHLHLHRGVTLQMLRRGPFVRGCRDNALRRWRRRSPTGRLLPPPRGPSPVRRMQWSRFWWKGGKG